MLYKNNGGRVVGGTKGKTFSKKVKKSKHLLRVLNAWGLDKQILDSLVQEGIEKIVIHETEEHVDYTVSVKTFLEKGIVKDFGHGEQVFLPLSEFHQENIKLALPVWA